MTLKEELISRGLLAQMSVDDLAKITETGERRLYVGVDPTGDSLHIGHLVPLLIARHFYRYGHQVVILVGGGTALIGDPSGKDEERPMVDAKVIKQNSRRLIRQIKQLFDEREFPIIDNSTWLNRLNITDFLREVGKHFTVGNLIQKEYIKNRLDSEQGLSFSEFSYPLIQAYDFYHLYLSEKVDLQIGGADQWGNVAAGVDFIRRKTGREVFGLTAPLVINQSTGRKFGKTEAGGGVWLAPDKTSPYRFYQFWLNTDDRGVMDYLKYYTFLSLERIEEIAADHRQSPERRSAQQILAEEVTALVHGEERTKSVKQVTEALFEAESINNLKPEILKLITEEIPTIKRTKTDLKRGLLLTDTLVDTGLVNSKREAREQIKNGAVAINDLQVSDPNYRLDPGDVVQNIAVILRCGKKYYSGVRVR